MATNTDFASQNLTMGQINAIVKGLGGEEGAKRFLRGELIVTVPNPPAFPTWKTIRLGGNKSAGSFPQAIEQANMKIAEYAEDVLGQLAFKVSETEREVDLVVVSVRDLGFKHGAPHRDIIAKALEWGLELCPNEVGPQLRLQYADQPIGEWLVIGMESIQESDGNLVVFTVRCDEGDLWLSVRIGEPGDHKSPGTRFVFVLPRK